MNRHGNAKGYLSPIGVEDDRVHRIFVDGPVEVYRSGSGFDVVAETNGRKVELGIEDATVSRKKEEAPLVFVPRRDAVELRNNGNKNDVILETSVRAVKIDTGETEKVTEDCTVSIGFNTEMRLTIEKTRGGRRTDTLTPEEFEEMLDDGIEKAAYIESLTDNLLKARNESANECLKYLRDLHNAVIEHPVEKKDYDESRERLEDLVQRLETKVSSDSLRDSGLGDEWRDRIDRIAHRVRRLYL